MDDETLAGLTNRRDQRRRLQEGVSLLDEYAPEWESQIDLDRLSMGDHRLCVLGQIYGTYDRGRFALHLDTKDAIEFGLDVGYYDSYQELTEAWRQVILDEREVS